MSSRDRQTHACAYRLV